MKKFLPGEYFQVIIGLGSATVQETRIQGIYSFWVLYLIYVPQQKVSEAKNSLGNIKALGKYCLERQQDVPKYIFPFFELK